ncbi:MAG: hypothetical protein AAB963_01770 [Patescibacteria group bacterium]
MGEIVGFNPEMGGNNVIELAKKPLEASDRVQELMKRGKYKEAQTLLDAVLDAQEGRTSKKDEEPRQAMAA